MSGQKSVGACCEGCDSFRPRAARDSGQIPIDPTTGEFVAGGIAEQTEQVLRNLRAVFEAAGLTMNHIVKTTVFLADMDDFAAMNEVYGRFFGVEPPARATVQAARLPRDARVEIEAIASMSAEPRE